jgi:hypothetical protein
MLLVKLTAKRQARVGYLSENEIYGTEIKKSFEKFIKAAPLYIWGSLV